MFNKKMSLFLITLAFMLSISAVAAVDTNSTDDVIAGEVDEEPPSGSVGSISVNEDTLTADSNESYVLTGSDVKTYYSGYDYTYTVVLKKDNISVKGASVSFKVGGQTYTKNTDANGKAAFVLKLNPINLPLLPFPLSSTHISPVLSWLFLPIALRSQSSP